MTTLPPYGRALCACALALGSTLLWGCASAGRVLSPEGHTGEALRYRSAVESGSSEAVRAAADRSARRGEQTDGVLARLEEARLASLGGDHGRSAAAYEAAVGWFERERQEASLRVSEGFFNATALATNDRALPYESRGFERLMAYNLLALEELTLGRIDFAQIALNGAAAESDALRERHAALERRTESVQRERSIDPEAVAGALGPTRAQLEGGAQTALRPYQNALTFYLMGVLFEARGDEARSRIALRRAAELYPSHPSLLSALGPGLRRDPDEALVVLVVADGWAPMKEALRLPFVWDGTLLQVAMPVYAGPRDWAARSGWSLQVDGVTTASTALLADLDAQARHDLGDRYAAIFTRQILRLVAKYQIQQRLEKENPWLGLAGQVFNLLTDQIDDRAWSTLPAVVEVGHCALSPGRHRLEVAGLGTPFAPELPPGGTGFLILNSVGSRVFQEWVLFDREGQVVTAAPTNQPE